MKWLVILERYILFVPLQINFYKLYISLYLYKVQDALLTIFSQLDRFGQGGLNLLNDASISTDIKANRYLFINISRLIPYLSQQSSLFSHERSKYIWNF